MIKRILPIALLGAALMSNTGCKNDGGFKTIKGVQYKIVKEGHGKKLQIGDYAEVNLIAKVDTTQLADSRKQRDGQPVPIPVQDVKGSGQWNAVLPMLSVGDSAVIEISCDTLLKNIPPQQQQLPPWMKKGNKIVVNISVVSAKNKDEYKKDMETQQQQSQAKMKEQAAAQMPIDDKILQDYFAKNNIKAEKTASGLYYTIQKPGSGANVANGQSVSIKYTGKTLAGKVFDSNVDTAISHHGDPLVFNVGQHRMIPGMDEGVTMLKKGSKATLYLPSPLAYGPQAGSPEIGPNSILIFEVEVLDVKAGAPQAPQMQAQPQ